MIITIKIKINGRKTFIFLLDQCESQWKNIEKRGRRKRFHR